MDVGLWIKIGQFLLCLSIIVLVHEWGHFFFARLFKTRVNKFYLFFDFLFPIPTLLNFSLFKKKKGDTEFGIGWFPLGGYVQIDGMMDETQSAEKLKEPPKPWEFRSKKAWQRLLIMMGGILVNVLLAFVVYAMILFTWGEKKIINSSIKDGIAINDSIMYNMGFRDGDKIISVNNKPVEYFDDIPKKVLIGGKTVEVERQGQKISLDIPENIIGQLSTKKLDRKGLIGFRMPAIIDSVPDPQQSNAFKAGMMPGDQIVRLDNKYPVNYWHEITPYVNNLKDSAIVMVTVKRGDSLMNFTVALDKNHKLGILPLSPDKLEAMKVYQVKTTRYGFFESFPAGVRKAFEKLKDYMDQFALLFKPKTEAYKGMGGFASMAKAFNESWDWESFWNITAFLSIIIAFMNFLPIPMLDGGYILFTLFEIITGRKVPDKFLEKANMIGFFIIIGLLLFANGMDIFRKLKGWF